MADLYQRKGGILSAPTVNKPIEQNNIISNISSGMASYMQQKANENFALGSRKLVDDVIKQSYELNPTDAKKFMDNVETNILKISNDLNVPDEYKEKMLDVVNTQVKGYTAKINQNLEKQIDSQNKVLVLESYNSSVDGQDEYYRGMAESIFNKDDKSYEAFKDVYNSAKRQSDNLINNARDKNGNPIIKQGAIRDIDKVDIISDFVYRLDYEQLKSFDENSFQDRDRLKEQLDLNNKEYDSLNTKIGKRLKELNEEHERVVRTQSYFNAAVQAKAYNKDVMDKLVKDGIVDSDYADAMEEYSKIEINEALMTDEDDNYLSQMALLKDLSQSKDDGSKDYPKNLMKKYAQTLREVQKYIKKNGSTFDISDTITNIAVNSATNQAFANATAKIYDENTALGQVLKEKAEKIYKEDVEKITKSQNNLEKGVNITKAINKSLFNIPSMISATTNFFSKQNTMKEAQKYVDKEAVQGTKIIMNLANMLENPFLSKEQKEQINIEIDKTLEKTNQNLIISKYTGLIPKSDLDKAVKNFKDGKPALITYNNEVVEFKGFTGDNLILERK